VPTVLIAAAANLGSIKHRGDFPDAMTFADTDALRALEAITRHRPNLVVLESAFAATSRGTALINRIKADPLLSRCEVRVVQHVTEAEAAPTATPAGRDPSDAKGPSESASTVTIPARPVVAPEPPTFTTPVTVTVPIAPPVPDQPASAAAVADTPPTDRARLDKTGTRRLPRVEMPPDVEVLVDGNPATLIDVSLEGAQIVSPTTLRPNQRVRLTLPLGLVPIRVIGEIAWAMFEMPSSGPRYRAGIALIDPDRDVMQRFIDAHAK
jgi:CheY-like chemotaxis protein